MAIDATRKGRKTDIRPWPDDIEMDPEVAGSVRERAKELGIEKFLSRLKYTRRDSKEQKHPPRDAEDAEKSCQAGILRTSMILFPLRSLRLCGGF